MSGNIVAVGLLTQQDLDLLGGNIARAWPVQDAPCFEELLQAIDEAERRARKRRASDEPQP